MADELGEKIKNCCVFFCDEFGTLPKIESAEMMFSALRSRRLQIVPIIPSFSQLEKSYGKEGAEIITTIRNLLYSVVLHQAAHRLNHYQKHLEAGR